jgi:hypothetical protein
MSSETLIGILILIIIALGVSNLRNKINKSDNTMLKTAVKVGDFIAKIRFLFFIIVSILLFAFVKSI